jgi:hypothetical protein
MRPKFLGTCAKFTSRRAERAAERSLAMSSPFRSRHVTDADWSRIGLSAAATPLVADSWYLLTLNLSAVFAVPNRSYTIPSRGDHVFQIGMSSGPKTRSGTNRP